MKKLLFIPLLFLTVNLYSAPTTNMSIVPVATHGAKIEAADENSRNNVVSSVFNAHTHEDITKLGVVTTGTWSSALGTITTGVWNATVITIPYGGTGATTLTDGGILLGSGTGAITALGVATNGQIPIGDGTTDPVLATITGTASEVDVTNAAGSITIGIVNPLAYSKGGTGGTSGLHQAFTADGNFTAPAGVTTVYLTMVGGGGGGGGGGSGVSAGGGAGGGAVIKYPYTVVAESTYAVDIGAAGTGGSATNNGTAGSNTTFNSAVIALGGNFGQGSTAGGAGGLAVGGFDAVTSTVGGYNLKSGAGANKGASNQGGAGAGSLLGTGGTSVDNSAGGNASGYGGGGGGAGGNNAGGNGSAGYCLVEW